MSYLITLVLCVNKPLHHLQHSLKDLRVNKVLFSAVFGLDMTNAAHGPSCWLSTLN